MQAEGDSRFPLWRNSGVYIGVIFPSACSIRSYLLFRYWRGDSYSVSAALPGSRWIHEKDIPGVGTDGRQRSGKTSGGSANGQKYSTATNDWYQLQQVSLLSKCVKITALAGVTGLGYCYPTSHHEHIDGVTALLWIVRSVSLGEPTVSPQVVCRCLPFAEVLYRLPFSKSLR